ncbi:MAG: hypothetical protein WCK02_02580 [Bacteroidota bacterium]
MKIKFIQNKIARRIFFALLIIYAVTGFVLTSAYIALKLKITNDVGTVDQNSRYFQNLDAEHKAENDSINFTLNNQAFIQYKLKILEEYFPKNAAVISNVLKTTGDFNCAEKMFDAVVLHLKDNQEFMNKILESEKLFQPRTLKTQTDTSLFVWMNLEDWKTLKSAIVKDKRLIDSAALLAGVEPRLIVSVLVGEQIRLFNSKRETYKKVLAPLTILSVESIYSLGVTGIKEFTAINVEKGIKDSASVYYLGKQYENLLDFKTEDSATERISRLVDYRNHYYSYIYAAIIIKQVNTQWQKAGFDISERPEILATLFNVGFEQSKPKADPLVGGSHIKVGEQDYTFGSLAYDFYYSGELYNDFPYKKEKWRN